MEIVDAAVEVEVLAVISAVAELSGAAESELSSGKYEMPAAVDVSGNSPGVRLDEVPAERLEKLAPSDTVSDTDGVGADGAPGWEAEAPAVISGPKLKLDSLVAAT